MLTGNEFFIVLKLVSGEDVMAVLSAEDDEYIELTSPMCIRTHPILNAGREQVTAVPLCPFSEENKYVLHKRNVMFIKKLHYAFIPHYKKIVADQEKTATFKPTEQSQQVEEDLKKRIDMLKSLLNETDEDTDYETKVFIKGNDTIN
jgi:hypothetical protein